jgi:hypothetical protein
MQVKREHGAAQEPFDQAEYERLRKHYFEPVVVRDEELPNGVRLRKQTKPPRIQGKSRGFEQLRKHIKVLEKRKDHREIFRLLCDLKQWETTPPSLGGKAHPADAMAGKTGGDAGKDDPVVIYEIDLTDDTLILDVDTFICDVLLMNVLSSKVKIEEGQPKRIKLLQPATFVNIKQEVAPRFARNAAAIAARAGAAARTAAEVMAAALAIAHLDMKESGITPSNATQAISQACEARRKGTFFLALNLCGNSLVSKEGGQFLGTLLKAKNLPLIVKLDVSNQSRASNTHRLNFAQELSNGLKGNKALSNFTFGDKQAVSMTTEMTDANFSRKLKPHEAQIVAAFLPKCT